MDNSHRRNKRQRKQSLTVSPFFLHHPHPYLDLSAGWAERFYGGLHHVRTLVGVTGAPVSQ